MKTLPATIVAAALLLPSISQGEPIEGTGMLYTINGDCEFRQTDERKTVSYLKGLKGRVWTMHFDDPDCMPEAADSANETARDFDLKQIGKKISDIIRGRVVQLFVRYDVDTFYHPGDVQSSGICMMDPEYPATAVAINPVSSDAGISRVEYSLTYGCGDPM